MPKQRHSKIRDEQMVAVYHAIKDYIEERNIPPSIDNICEGSFLSKGTVYLVLELLAARGFIEREEGVARGIRVTDKPFSLR